MKRATSTLAGYSSLSLIALCLAWLAPNHYLPWAAFHADLLAAFAFSGLMLAALLPWRRVHAVPTLAVGVLLLACIPMVQFAFGLLPFLGDAAIASLYLLGTALCIIGGATWVRSQSLDIACALALAIYVAALASTLLALTQWLEVYGLGILVIDMPPGGRPFANIGQPNQLATLLCLGLASACLLRQRAILGAVGLAASGLVLCFGVAMTQSRAGLLEVAVLVLFLLAFRRRAALRISRLGAASIGLTCAAFTLAWPALCSALLLSSGRTIDAQAQGGTRLTHWASFADAIYRAPWFGYGWNNAAVAQARVAVDHPFSGEMVEHSHSIVLDLLVWNGVPIGAFVVGALAWWFWRQCRRCEDATVTLLLACIAMVFAHGLLELPLEYAYFLLPVAFMMGMVEARSPAGKFVLLPHAAIAALSALALAMLTWVTVEYVQAEDDYRLIRFEAARIGPPRVQGDTSSIVLLTQLREFVHFARTEARRGMSTGELERMRMIAERYGHPPVLFRYALASALNGSPSVARETLARLCKTHPVQRCVEAREGWAAMVQGEYPELGAVQVPAEPRDPSGSTVTRLN